MRRCVELCVGLIALAACDTPDREASLAIRDVDLFDSRTGSVVAGQTILIDGETILEVVDAGAPFTADEVIDGNGRLAVPGFVDTHGHLLLIQGDGGFGPSKLDATVREYVGRLYLPHGTTTIADMGQPEGWLDTMVRWEATPDTESPNLVVVGGSLNTAWDGPAPMHHEKLAGPDEAREKAREWSELGVERLKLYRRLQIPEMEAVVSEASALGQTPFAHVDNGVVTISEAMDLGVLHFEHFFTLIASILELEVESAKLREQFGIDRARSLDEYTAELSYYFGYIDRHPEHRERLLSLLDSMAERGASLSTTIAIPGSAAGRTRFFSSFEPLPPRERAELPYDETQLAALERAFDTMLDYVRLAHERGVLLRIGTDSRNGGEAMLSELLLLTEAGIPTAEVLQIATFHGAQALGTLERHGVLEPGRQADLILFSESPLENPEHLLSPKEVIKSGRRYVPKPSLTRAVSARLIDEGFAAAETWLIASERSPEYGPLQSQEMVEAIYQHLESGRPEVAEGLWRLFDERFPRSEDPGRGPNEAHLNRLGYQLLARGETERAVDLLGFVPDLFPSSWNAYDSYAEALLAAGDRPGAIINYRKSLELNPENGNARTVLEELGE